MTENDHNADDREVTNSLIELSEIAKHVIDSKLRNAPLKNAPNDYSESVRGWRPSLENPSKPNNAGNVKKKRPVERSLTEFHHGNSFQPQPDEYWSNASGVGERKAVVRCMGDDCDTFPIPPWKSNIEQGTCRYVHDNGSYRTLKFMYDDRKEWYTMRKTRPEKVSTTWNHACRRMQREMKRQLKKDIAQAEKEREKNSSSRASIDPSSGEETHRSRSRVSFEEPKQSAVTFHEPTQERNNIHTTHSVEVKNIPDTVKVEPTVIDKPPLKPIESLGKGIYKKEIRIKSTHSDGAINQGRKMKTIHESEPVTPIPQYSIPSGGQMLKSVSDLFIENFSSRISALEDEIKKDSKWLRKNENELTKIQASRTKYRDATRSNFKDSGSNSVTPRAPAKTETLTSDIFSVTPMAQKELAPLEKTGGYSSVKDKSRSNSINSENTPGDFSRGFLNKNNHLTQLNGFKFNSEMERNLTNLNSTVDYTKQALINTLTGTKINTIGNKKSSKGFSTPSTITICDNSSSNASPSHTLTDPQGESYKNVSFVDKKHEKKVPVQSIPALLPEIAGKRLEPTSISQRLL
ncbi:hypothetical protein ACF0H5_006415 [Mactra antiquata]